MSIILAFTNTIEYAAIIIACCLICWKCLVEIDKDYENIDSKELWIVFSVTLTILFLKLFNTWAELISDVFE